MAIQTKTVTECTCDVCGKVCKPEDTKHAANTRIVAGHTGGAGVTKQNA